MLKSRGVPKVSCANDSRNCWMVRFISPLATPPPTEPGNKNDTKISYNSSRGTTSALTRFHAGALSWLSLNLEILVFQEGGEPGTWRKTIVAGRETTTNSTRTGIEPGVCWCDKRVPLWLKCSAILRYEGTSSWNMNGSSCSKSG